MLYLIIDQHNQHLTINIRNEQGAIIQKGQVSTNHADIDDFFVAFAKKRANIAVKASRLKHCGYIAIIEVCGFDDWLLEHFSKFPFIHIQLQFF